jgi:hypothetical protein
MASKIPSGTQDTNVTTLFVDRSMCMRSPALRMLDLLERRRVDAVKSLHRPPW